MSMQKLSLEQMAILSILHKLEFEEVIYDNKTLEEEETNETRFRKIEPDLGLDVKDIKDIIEELTYWGYIDENYSLTVLGRQYIRTGPNCTDSSVEKITTKNYNITLFEKLAELKGIEVNFSAKGTLIENLSNIFSWKK